jgi:pilus assembly protein CpaF
MDLLHAMNTGHRGCLASIHANSTRDALSRLQGLVRMSSASLSETLVQEWIGKNIHFLIHCGRVSTGVRQVVESAWVRGLDGPRILLEVTGHGT